MKFLMVLVFVSTSTITALADNPLVVLQPGSQITVYEIPTDVSCALPAAPAFARYCKCSLEGFNPEYSLDIILDDQGNTDQLGQYATQALCEKSLSGNPACTNK